MIQKSDPTDQELIVGCISGDKTIQAIFVDRYSNDLYMTVLYTLKNKQIPHSLQDVEDLHQNVFAALFEKKCKKIKQFKGTNGCSLRTWLKIIATRIVVDHLRSCNKDALSHQQPSEVFEVLNNASNTKDNPLTMMTREEKRHILNKCLASLKARDALVLKLHFFRGMTIRQAAQEIGITESNAYIIKRRAMDRLREMLDKYE